MTSSSPSPQASMHENDDGTLFFGMVILSVALYFGMAILSVALLFVLLILYIHRNCCVLQDPINLHSHSHSHSPPPKPPLTLGLDPAEIRSLPVVLCRRETTAEKEECCICLCGFEEGEKMKVLTPCLHCYHCECVDRWLKNESSCPLCRVSIRVDSSSLYYASRLKTTAF